MRERFEEIAGYAREALEREDAWEGFCELIWRAAERNAEDLAFCEAVAFTDQSGVVAEVGLAESTNTLMARAKAQGRMRARRDRERRPDDDVRRLLRDAPEPDGRRVAALPHADAGRAARVVVSPAMAANEVADPRSKGSPGIWTRCSMRGRGAAGVEALLDDAQRRADAFAAAHAGKVAELDGPGLAAAMRELATLQELVGRAGSYAMLNFATATADPERGALLQLVQERGTQIETALIFFELEWAALDDERAEALLADDGLDFCRHHLRSARRYRPHLLSEPEERILAEKSLTSSSAWTRLFEEQAAAIAVTLPDAEEPVALEIALARLFSPDREERRTSAEAVTEALQPGLRVRGYVLNTLLAEKMVDDRLRSYPHWLASRNLANEASDESVERADRGGPRPLRAAAPLVPAQGAAARRRPAGGLRPHGGGHRRGRVDPVGAPRRTWCSTRSPGFAPELADTARAFFDERRIDAPVRPGKRGGAFCSYTVPSAAPYVLLNYTVAPPRRAHARARARPRRARGARAPPGRVPLRHAADAGRDRERLRRDARVRPPARRGADAGVAAGPARREHRGLDRDRLPPGRDEPLRAPRAHDAGARRASCRSTASARSGRSRRRSCWATRSR